MRTNLNKLELLKMKCFLLCLISITLNTQCSGDKKKNVSTNDRLYAETNTKKTSIIDLIANSKNHDKKSVQIKGFIHIEIENSAIYLSENDYLYGIGKNSLWIEISKEEISKFSMNDQYVMIDGFFDMENKGHEGNYSGAIVNIKKISSIKSLKMTENSQSNLK